MPDAAEAMTSTPGDDQTTGQKRKRLPRALLACESCRTRKLRCDQDSPCTNCSKRNLQCHYRSLDVQLPGSVSGRHRDEEPNTRPNDALYGSKSSGRPHRPLAPLPLSEIPGIGVISAKGWGNQRPIPTSISTAPSHEGYRELGGGRLSFPTDLSTHIAEQDVEPNPDSFGEASHHTQGTEPYPSGIYSFLRRLRLRSGKQGSRPDSAKESPRSSRDARDLSIGSLIRPSQTDSPVPYPATIPPERKISHHLPSPSPTFNTHRNYSPASAHGTPGGAAGPFAMLSNSDIEKECVRLYFQNLHLVHPILDQTSFIARCETDIWEHGITPDSHHSPRSSFLALFNAVLAIGAIIAGDDAVFMRDVATVRQTERFAGSNQRAPTYPPLKLAKLFFERAKANLGDVFEACSLESTQALLLMTVFCQNALKPHSCYLYSGMAVRSALAIGLPNYSGPEAAQASALWWNMYSFEIEMCASAGRESSLREPRHYRLALPHVLALEDKKQDFTGHMVALSEIMAQLSREIYQVDDAKTLREKSQNCLDLDRRLLSWKSQLPSALDFDQTSLVEPEWVSKQKVVLRNRFLNAKILLHRPFLIAAATETDPAPFMVHVNACVSASVETILSLYEMYKHRPYFRTWWYNTTYTLYASMILLYVVLTNMQSVDRQYCIQAVEKSLEIFNAMNMVGVARRCAEITTEVLELAKKPANELGEQANPPDSATTPVASAGFAAPNLISGALGESFGIDLSKEDLYASLVDPNIMDGFAEFESGYFEIPDFNSVLGGYSLG